MSWSSEQWWELPRAEFSQRKLGISERRSRDRRYREVHALSFAFVFPPQIRKGSSHTENPPQDIFIVNTVYTWRRKNACTHWRSPPFPEHILCISCVRLRIYSLRRDYFSAENCWQLSWYVIQFIYRKALTKSYILFCFCGDYIITCRTFHVKVFFHIRHIFILHTKCSSSARSALLQKGFDMPANNRPRKYTEFVRLRLTAQQFSKLQTLCDHKSTTVSVECRKAIDQYLQNIYDVALPVVMEQLGKQWPQIFISPSWPVSSWHKLVKGA